MRISLTARHYKAPEKLKEYAQNEVRRLKKYYDGIIECDIILDYEKKSNSIQIAEIAIKVYGQKMVAREKSEDIYKSINQAVDKLERRVIKYKEKLKNHKHEKVFVPDSPTSIEEE